jgi:RNA polymerase sigma-70 factor (ECF subfamily)
MSWSSLTNHQPVRFRPTGAECADVEAAFNRYKPALYRYLIVRVGGDAHLAEDLLQQLWLQTSGNGSAAVPEDELEFWLRGVARNLVRAHWRQSRQRPPHLPIAEPELARELADRLGGEELPPEILERKEVRDQLLLALTALPGAEQELIFGHYFSGRTHGELAAATGLSERAIEGRLYRARRWLQERLRHLEP